MVQLVLLTLIKNMQKVAPKDKLFYTPLILLFEITSSFLSTSRYSEACLALGKHPSVAGFIAQSPIKKVSI